MKLPIAGQRPRGEGTPSAGLGQHAAPRSLLLLMAHRTASPWPLLGGVSIPVRRLQAGTDFSREWRDAPLRHEVLTGSPGELAAVIADGPQVLLGEWAVEWVLASCVVVCTPLPRHAWPPELRHVDPDLILRDPRPALIQALSDRV